MILSLLGAVAIVVSIFVTWYDFSAAGYSDTLNAGDFPAQFLIDNKVDVDASPSISVLLAPAAALLAVGAVVARARVLGAIGGGVAIAVSALFSIQWQRLFSEQPAPASLTDFLGIGVYIAGVGGIIGLVGSLLPRR